MLQNSNVSSFAILARMGSNISFFAFDQQPDVRALSAITWLTAFSSFRRKGSSEWYLEGPCRASRPIAHPSPGTA
jgi:hypothetical protein